MLQLKGVDAVATDKMSPPKYLWWTPAIFSGCGTSAANIDKQVRTQLQDLVKVSNLYRATIVENATTGLDFRYGAVPNGWSSAPATISGILNYPLLRFGPIPIPTKWTINFQAVNQSGRHNNLYITAVCGSTVYNIFAYKQHVIDANYGWSTNGVYYNGNTKLQSISSSTTLSRVFTKAQLTKCFTKGEKTCDVFIMRHVTQYHTGTNAGNKSMSPFHLKELKIEWE